MPPRDRSSITKGMFLTHDSPVPALFDPPPVRGVPYDALLKKRRAPTRTFRLQGVDSRLKAAAVANRKLAMVNRCSSQSACASAGAREMSKCRHSGSGIEIFRQMVSGRSNRFCRTPSG